VVVQVIMVMEVLEDLVVEEVVPILGQNILMKPAEMPMVTHTQELILITDQTLVVSQVHQALQEEMVQPIHIAVEMELMELSNLS